MSPSYTTSEHCALCHQDMDLKTFLTGDCRVAHWFDFDLGVTDVTAPAGFQRRIFFSTCCAVVKVVTSKATDAPDYDEQMVHYSAPGVDESYCYQGAHVGVEENPAELQNDSTMVSCELLGCSDHPGKGVQLANAHMDIQHALHADHAKWWSWFSEDETTVPAYGHFIDIPPGVRDGKPWIAGAPYIPDRVFRAADWIHKRLGEAGPNRPEPSPVPQQAMGITA